MRWCVVEGGGGEGGGLYFTSMAKLLLGLYISGMEVHWFVLTLYLSALFILVIPLKPPTA